MRRGRKCQRRRNHRTGRFQTKSAGATEKGGIYTDKACGLNSSPSGEDYKKSGRHGHFHATAFVYFYSYRDYSARKVKRLKSTIFNSGSASFNTSLTVFLASMISSWFSKQTSFRNLPRRPLAMF